MRSDVLQAVAICCYGNAFLGAGEGRAAELLGCNSTFRSVRDLKFERGSAMTNLTGSSIAEGTSPWFRRLQSEGVERLRLHLEPCSLLPDPAAGSWGILTDGDVGLEIWHPTWKSQFARYNEQTMWKVVYTSTRFSRWALAEPARLEDSSKNLIQILQEAAGLCQQQDAAAMEEILLKFVRMHEASETSCPGFQDILPLSMSLEAKAIAASALRAVMLISSEQWTQLAKDVRSEHLFKAATNALWQSALKSFEAAALQPPIAA